MTAPESNAPESPEGSRPFVFGDVVANSEEPGWGTARFLKSHPIKDRDQSAVLLPDVNVGFWRTTSLVLVEVAEASAASEREATALAMVRAARTELQILREQAASARPIAGYLVRIGYAKNQGAYVRHEDGYQRRAARRDATVFETRERAVLAAEMIVGPVRIVPTRRKP